VKGGEGDPQKGRCLPKNEGSDWKSKRGARPPSSRPLNNEGARWAWFQTLDRDSSRNEKLPGNPMVFPGGKGSRKRELTRPKRINGKKKKTLERKKSKHESQGGKREVDSFGA